MCRAIAPCGTCDGCVRIKAMPPWTPEDSDPDRYGAASPHAWQAFPDPD